MQVKELIEYLSKQDPEAEVKISLLTNGSIRGAKTSIESVHQGMGLDHNSVLVFPSVNLTDLTREEVRGIISSIQKGQSWHHGEVVRKLKDKIHTYCPHCSYTLDPEQARKDRHQEQLVSEKHKEKNND